MEVFLNSGTESLYLFTMFTHFCLCPNHYFWRPPISSLNLIFCFFCFQLSHRSEIIQCLSFSYLTYFSKHMSPDFIHVVTKGRFPSFDDLVVFHCIYAHLSADGHLGCFHILAVGNNAAVSIRTHISFQVSVSIFFR